MKRYYLVFQTRSDQKTIYPLIETTTIGRDTSNLIRLSDSTASRNHGRISYQQGFWVVEDLGSANGIIYRGVRVEKASLKPGDSFKIGQTIFSIVEREIAKSKDLLQTTMLVLSATIAGAESTFAGVGKDRQPGRLMDVISVIPFFVPLQEEERQQLAETATMHVFNAGEVIMEEGDPGRSIYVILDGKVRVFVEEPGGNELELTTLEVGQFFGVTSLIGGQPRSSSVAALESSVVVELRYTSMAEVMKQNAAVKNVLMQYYKARKRTTQKKPAVKEEI